MQPSRGLPVLGSWTLLYGAKRTRCYSSWAAEVARPSNTVQSYISSSNDPYINLSIEHFLLQTTPPQSKILFLYTNRPCVVIGRNQNPWLEVNLGILKAGRTARGAVSDTEPPGIGDVHLVRRRSGGGTVFHDEGNVNWSVICPSEDFTRDKHAEMVVHALRSLGVDRARVNERHDIVLDQGSEGNMVDPNNTHVTAYTVKDPAGLRPLKVSGSAYKLIKGRALHHGTCLLQSPNLHTIPQYLHSPAEPYIKARGVESVSSPVGNIGIEKAAFVSSVQNEFGKVYAAGSQKGLAITVGEDLLAVQRIRKGYDELNTSDWTYLQTPQFLFSSHPTEEDPRLRPVVSSSLPPSARVMFKVRYGVIAEARISMSNEDETAMAEAAKLSYRLEGRPLHEIRDWFDVLKGSHVFQDDAQLSQLAEWLAQMLPTTLSQSPPSCDP